MFSNIFPRLALCPRQIACRMRHEERFLKTTGAVAGTATASISLAAKAARTAADEITIGAIGCGGQGTALARSFASQPNVRLAYVCDVDQARAARAAEQVAEISGERPQIFGDLRQLLDLDAVDAVTVATPDHWHGPATILACDAGKHVYVEKPCAHNIREGRLMIDAARRNRRVVQVGTQSRSGEHTKAAVERLREGAIGDILVAKAWNSQRRANIGHAQPSEPPAGFDYDVWLGPATEVPFQANRHHYTWHWWYDFGTGDMGNDGVHELDIARWGLGVETHPARVVAAGGKLFFDDDQQFPDTQYVAFTYPAGDAGGQSRQLIFEQRIWSPYTQAEHENGNAFYGTDGVLILGKRDGWKLYGPRNELRESMESTGIGPSHHENFLEAIRGDATAAAEIEIGHLSSSLCHLGNIAVRVGGKVDFDPDSEQIVGDESAAQLVRREYRPGHWAVPSGV